jgi:hypothetical protein
MPLLVLKALECSTAEDISDECRLEIAVDGQAPIKLKRDLDDGERWVLDRSFSFQRSVQLKLWDEDWPDSDDHLGTIYVGTELKHRARGKFTEYDADYTLWYEVIDPTQKHQISTISLRKMLGRMGQGVLSAKAYGEIQRNTIYQCSEVISLRETFRFHAQQDRGKGNTTSVKTWINRHCNAWGEESVIPVSTPPEALADVWDNRIGIGVLGKNQWPPVTDEESYCVAGFQDHSRLTNTDGPTNHKTMDWCWDQIVDPAFLYMLTYTAKGKRLIDREKIVERERCWVEDTEPPTRFCRTVRERVPVMIEYPLIHNELETGSMPLQWRPFGGEYVTTWGRHVFDIAHMPVTTEIHPAHSIVREHTTAGPLGNRARLVPVNRAIIGMGLSGGFLGNVGSRWQDETGHNPPDGIWGDTKACWATNLKRHPLKFKFFPPVPPPSPTAELRYRIVLCEYIQVSDWDKVDDFLEVCQWDDPADGGEELAFREWDRARGLPKGFTPQVAPLSLRPQFTLRNNAYFDVEVDLSSASQIPVGYYAILECGWSEKGNHTIHDFELTFEKLRVEETEEYGNEWHLFYGINGQWESWYKPYGDMDGDSFTFNKRFRVFTIDDMPLSIRDCGIEWEGEDFDNYYLDRVEITASGPNHFDRILRHKGVYQISRTGNVLRFKAKGWEIAPPNPDDKEWVFGDSGFAKHEWWLKLEKRGVL